MIEIDQVYKSFGQLDVLQGVSMTVSKGEVISLIGGSGSGKSTLLMCINGLEPIQRGSIRVDGTNVHAPDTNINALRQRIGIVFQQWNAFPHLTVLENVRIGLQRETGLSFHFWQSEKRLNQLNDRAQALLEQVDLGNFANEITSSLPYGRKRALEIATTLAMEPELMLLDEPTQGMGHEDVDRVTQLIKRVSVGRTILMVEHNMNVVSSIADTITVLARGAVLAEGPYSQVSRDPAVMEAYMGTTEGELEGAHA